jgi:GrpB-like predicted nucleotidyltransferase (UPF0157 family)
MRKTHIVPWTEEWTVLFEKEAKALERIFQENVIKIHHIGSTAIPTIGYAKPIIDILLEVKDLSDVDRLNPAMLNQGYEAKGENGIPGRRFFQKGGDNRTHHVHVFQTDDKQIDFHLDFKNYLLLHPEQAKRYTEKKLELAAKFPNEHQSYQEGKQELVAYLAIAASEWGKSQRSNETNNG